MTIGKDYRYFTDFLLGKGSVNVIFEPFIPRDNVENLIWRRGDHLWQSPSSYIDTLASLTDRTRADVVFADIRSYNNDEKAEAIEFIEKYQVNDGIGFALVCDSDTDIALAESCKKICCIASYGGITSTKLPVIRMDGRIEDAIDRGDCGYFASENAEELLKTYGDRIRILGGLGRAFVLGSSPVKIYSYVEDLAKKYPGKWACGSGTSINGQNYLELISLLGAFARIR